VTTRIVRQKEWAFPPPPVRRELLEATPAGPSDAAPLLFVPGFGHGAWAFAENWLEHAAERGFHAYAMSLRGHGGSGSAAKADLRAYVHDVVQVAAGLPRQAVLVGHGASALVVAMALARYPARAAVLVSPVFGGWAAALALLARSPATVLPGVFGRPVRPRRGQLFSRELAAADARRYAQQIGGAARRAQWQVARGRSLEEPVGDPSVLVVGSPDDRLVSRSALTAVATRYGGAPLLFPGMGHDLMLDERWQEPIDAILDWLDKPDAP
jgi:pimeloyl-ACP methyl ester carboxylesterase